METHAAHHVGDGEHEEHGDDAGEDRNDERVHEHAREVEHVTLREQRDVAVERVLRREERVGERGRVLVEAFEEDPYDRQQPYDTEHRQQHVGEHVTENTA